MGEDPTDAIIILMIHGEFSNPLMLITSFREYKIGKTVLTSASQKHVKEYIIGEMLHLKYFPAPQNSSFDHIQPKTVVHQILCGEGFIF